MGNKCDRADERKVSDEAAKAWCRDNNIPYFETSALSNTCVDEAFMAMVKKALDNQESDEMVMPDTIGGIGGIGGGSIALNARTTSASEAYKRKKKCKC